MLIKPKEGLAVRHHLTRQLLEPAGIEVASDPGSPEDPIWKHGIPRDAHWMFMMQHGDVVGAPAPEPEPEPKSEPEPEPAEPPMPDDARDDRDPATDHA